MLKYFFGVGDDTGSLRNEPTIDYNNTLPSLNTSLRGTSRGPLNPIEAISRDADARYTRYDYKDNTRAVIDFSDDDLDSDEEVTRDFNMIMDNFTRTSEHMSRYSDDRHSTAFSLPSDYPGKFETPRDAKSGGYTALHSQHRPPKNRFLDETWQSGGRKGTKQTNERVSVSNPKDPLLFTEKINVQIEELQQQVENELRSAAGSEVEDVNVKRAMEKITLQNEFLSQLNALVDLNMASTEEQSIPNNLLQKYHILKQEYLKELHNSQDLYKGYYKLILKYRLLRKNHRHDDPAGNNTADRRSVNRSTFTVKEKIRLIKSTSNQESIKLICVNVLKELESLENKDAIIESYKRELEAANAKIKELETTLQDRNSTRDTTQP
ncbi:uncharacterized protein CANTADRAFT_4768 [Suhomyces tanzawaensis NRRL Y-17324]|uniref:Spindle pole body component Bbp1 C-terminal domain-containing protein n=1 Tax=Suhomyces tanzawaensis NRRL Y-17324 TaxID=984487 RepID=A0A1E4SMM1_9ASCO|nr:uncharacterized protein CANTADRAFT_4768 [Suhomyces tanzawaensis NRRL Y-17324]ODV80763.1 hypothetical protein CANTADRAFT_4768 [Suhomyces tanzawaensis NRRL Y-17324]